MKRHCLLFAIIPAIYPIPDTEVILDHNGTGIDWTYAGPVHPGPDLIETPDYRASEGWRYATEEEWTNRPDWEDFTRPGFVTPDPAAAVWHTDLQTYRFTTHYWADTIAAVNLGDAAAGYVGNGNGLGVYEEEAETWYVRDSRTPEPESLLIAIVCLFVCVTCYFIVLRMRKS